MRMKLEYHGLVYLSASGYQHDLVSSRKLHCTGEVTVEIVIFKYDVWDYGVKFCEQ